MVDFIISLINAKYIEIYYYKNQLYIKIFKILSNKFLFTSLVNLYIRN